MKSKLYLLAFVLISLFMFSCSNDDLENLEIQNRNFELKGEIPTQKPDSTLIKSESTSEYNQNDYYEGDPSNPKPPRK